MTVECPACKGAGWRQDGDAIAFCAYCNGDCFLPSDKAQAWQPDTEPVAHHLRQVVAATAFTAQQAAYVAKRWHGAYEAEHLRAERLQGCLNQRNEIFSKQYNALQYRFDRFHALVITLSLCVILFLWLFTSIYCQQFLMPWDSITVLYLHGHS
jgi:hypothetical protein